MEQTEVLLAALKLSWLLIFTLIVIFDFQARQKKREYIPHSGPPPRLHSEVRVLRKDAKWCRRQYDLEMWWVTLFPSVFPERYKIRYRSRYACYICGLQISQWISGQHSIWTSFRKPSSYWSWLIWDDLFWDWEIQEEDIHSKV